MAFTHGKTAFFSLDNAAGVLTDISAFLDDVGFPQTVETAETTTFGNSSKTYIVGLKDSTISLSGKFDLTLDTHVSAVVGQAASLSFSHAPQGNTAANVLYTGECFVTSYDVSAPVGDVVTVSIELQVTGNVTRTII